MVKTDISPKFDVTTELTMDGAKISTLQNPF